MSDYLDEVIESNDDVARQLAERIARDDGERPTEQDRFLSSSITFPNKVLDELNDLSKSARESVSDLESSDVQEWKPEQKDDIVLFFTFVGIAQEHYLRRAVAKRVFQQEALSNALLDLIFDMNPNFCLELLHAAGVVGDGKKGEISQVKQERNEIVHDISWWLFHNPDPGRIIAQMNRAERSLVHLIEIAEDKEFE